MDKQLRVKTGPDAGRVFPLPYDRSVHIGRSHQHTDLCLNDPHCARVHCSLEIAGDRVSVVAVDDETKVFVNGERVTRHELSPSDVVHIGTTTFSFEFPFMPRPATAAGEVGAPKGLAALVGHTLGHFEIASVLGQGHHGMVFLARDTQHHREVALKVLRPAFPANAQELRHFGDVYKRTLPLRHPNVVGLHGVGKTGPYCWLALEVVNGRDLGRLLREKDGTPVEWPMALRVAMGVGQALDFARENRLSHRNVTPGNILWDEKAERAEVSDFGFGEAIEASALQVEVLEEKFLAELSYLAPEQTMLDAYVDDVVDIYRLGAVLYHLLTGRPPVHGAAPEDTLQQIRDGAISPPRRKQKAIPREFERIVLKMLATRQEDRYLTPREMLIDLEAVEERSSSKARP